MSTMTVSCLETLETLGSLHRDEPMMRHTSFRIGGPADLFLTVGDPDALTKAMRLAQEHGLDVFILGGGTNILVSDDGLRGLVVHNHIRGFETLGEGLFRVGARESLAPLAKRLTRQGWQGLEWAVGIPGSIGGATVGNAGAFGQAMANVVQAITALFPDGSLRRIAVSELDFTYRSSRIKLLQPRPVVVSVELQLQPSSKLYLGELVKEYQAKRRLTQPQEPSAGSVFKNPPSYAAGWLIEQVGLKGKRVGEAQISPTHANFIINLGHAKAIEVIELISLARDRVQQTFGIRLELEIELMGQGLGEWREAGNVGKERRALCVAGQIFAAREGVSAINRQVRAENVYFTWHEFCYY